MKITTMCRFIICFAVIITALPARSGTSETLYQDQYNVIWNTPGGSVMDSMPIGNGDIGMNIWVEQTGDVILLLSKVDAFDENSILMKLGRVRIKMQPAMNTSAGFAQHLRLRAGQIEITSGTPQDQVKMLIWIDANRPVIHVESSSVKAFGQVVTLEPWRTKEQLYTNTQVSDMFKALSGKDPYPTAISPDVMVPAKNNRLVWYHHNRKRDLDGYLINLKLQGLEQWAQNNPHPLLDRIFGAAVEAEGFIAENDTTLKTINPASSHHVAIYALTCQPGTPEKWQDELNRQIESVKKTPLEIARKEHQVWWVDFWNRSRIDITGQTDVDGKKEDGGWVSGVYNLCRYMSACAGRGKLPIKFNGSIFSPGEGDNPDFRRWGGVGFWFQNERMVYWPMLAAGDFDLMNPWFTMYQNILPLLRERTKIFFGHDGAFFPETITFWGAEVSAHYGWMPFEKRKSPLAECTYVTYYWQSSLEQMLMMFDYWDYTQDEKFAREILLPHAEAVTVFYDKHYQRDNAGHIHFGPASSLETWHVAANPVPEIAGLKFTLEKLLTMPETLTTPDQRQRWKDISAHLPALPTGTFKSRAQYVLELARQFPGWAYPGDLAERFGRLEARIGQGKDFTVLLPAEMYSMKNNVENPELYSVFPYRIYGVGKPDLKLAKDTFAVRMHQDRYCWYQNGIQAALLGLTDDAVRDVVTRASKDYTKHCRFPAMFDANYDSIPDIDHGGGLQSTLQRMLMQCEGKKILLLPAWPKGWDADFKLHAPMQTTVEGKVRNGKIEELVVTPAKRINDIIYPG